MTPADRILIVDDVLADPVAYRQAALARPFGDIDMAPAIFHGIALCGDEPTLPAWVASRFGVTPELSFFRQSPAGQVEPNFLHTDLDMGEWTAILYLTPDPPPEDGTAFWRHRATGRVAATAPTSEATLAEVAAWRDLDQWEVWHRAPARFNRVVLFPAGYYHARAIFANYGQGDDARLTQVLFGSGELPTLAGVQP